MLAAGCDRGEKAVFETRLDVFGASGIPVEITVVHADETKARAAVEKAFAAMREAASPLNFYDSGSELSRLNAAAGKPVKVGAGLREVIALSLAVAKETDGAFDPTVGPLVSLWKPFIKGEKREPPSTDTLAAARVRVGWNKIRLEGDTVTLEPGMNLDLGAIAKGYVVDKGLFALRADGVGRAAVNASGHIAVIGLSPSGVSWKFGIQIPGAPRGAFKEALDLPSGAMATSGDYEQFVDYKGKRCHHILDPRTGEPSASGLASATVFAPDAASADALATAMVVLGADKGRGVLARRSARGFFLASDGREIRVEPAPAAASGWLPVALAASGEAAPAAGVSAPPKGFDWNALLLPAALVGGLGLLFGIGLFVASRVFLVEEDPRVGLLTGALPGANCGSCGFPGCGGFARALIHGSAPLNVCNPGGAATVQKIAGILGRTAPPMENRLAVLHCAGRAVKEASRYAGVLDCRAAAAVQGGTLACPFGCMRLRSCVRACPFDAISMDSGFPEVIEEKCTACGNCVKACPKGLFELAPAEKMFHVLCRSHEWGKAVKDACAVGCIACLRCVKACPSKAIDFVDNLASIDCARCTNCGACVKVCPSKTILDFRPRRGVEILAASAPAPAGGAA